jgi:hypothetical protein
MRCHAGSDFADLVYHALAWLTPPDASSAHDPRYVQWVRATLPPAAWAPLAEDAPLLTALYAQREQNRVLHALPRLHDSIASFLASAHRPLESLDAHAVQDPALLRALLGLDRGLVEILRASMALTARAYREAHPDSIAPELAHACAAVMPWLEEGARVVPSFAAERVELVFALGARGRGLGERILVGAPAAWNGLAPAASAVQALHEHAVHTAMRALSPRTGSHERYVRAEWAALVALSRAMEGAREGLQAAHAQWVAGLSVAALAHEAVKLGLVDEGAAQNVVQAGTARAAVLSRL